MSLSRRSFTFASLVAALAPVARAAEPASPDEPSADRAPPLQVVGEVARRARHLELTLRVTCGAEPLDLRVADGSRPAGQPRLFVAMDGVRMELQPIIAPPDRRELVSRMGPMPRYQQLAAAESVALGPYRFDWSNGPLPETVEVEAELATSLGVQRFRIAAATGERPRS